MESLVRLRGVCKAFRAPSGDEILALSDIDLNIGKGEFVSLIGPSGCGKSTLLNIVAGLLEPSSGDVSVNGQHPKAVRAEHELGVVFQDPTLLPWRTTRQNVAFLLQVTNKLDDAAWRRVDELLELVGLTDFSDHYPHQLSGGMRQRAAIARALSLDPLLLLMDEPFGALDEFTRTRMNEELLRIWAMARKTVLFVTHNIAESVYLSDRVIAMGVKPGRIVHEIEIGIPRPRNLKHRYEKLFIDAVVELQKVLEEGGESGDE